MKKRKCLFKGILFINVKISIIRIPTLPQIRNMVQYAGECPVRKIFVKIDIVKLKLTGYHFTCKII